MPCRERAFTGTGAGRTGEPSLGGACVLRRSPTAAALSRSSQACEAGWLAQDVPAAGGPDLRARAGATDPGLSGRELAQAAGLSQSTVSRAERGASVLSLPESGVDRRIRTVCARSDRAVRRFGRSPAGGRLAEHSGGSARSYLTLSTLATVRQSWDDHPDHLLTMPLQRGSLFSTMGALPGPPALRG
jgi:transcriptional regulator with XRE-family HTH domain